MAEKKRPRCWVGGWRGDAGLRRPGRRFLAFPTQGLNPSPWSSASVSSHLYGQPPVGQFELGNAVYPELTVWESVVLETGLIGSAKASDLAAFEALVGPLIEPASQLARALLRDWHEAEDAVQEATFKAWRAVGRLHESTTSPRAWFLTIVANESVRAAADAGGGSSGWPSREAIPPGPVRRSRSR